MESSSTIVLISGANQGLGFEITKKLVSENPTYYVLMGCRLLEKGRAAASFLQSRSVEPVELDVTSDDSISRGYEGIQRKYGRLDVLINNAGIATAKAGDKATMRQKFDEMLSTNATSAACLTNTFLPLLRKSANSRIIFMSSSLGSLELTLTAGEMFAWSDVPEYKTSKVAANMISAYYAVKLKDEGFKVNTCCPGYTATRMTSGAGQETSLGAINACRLATTGKDGETGTFTHKDGTYPW